MKSHIWSLFFIPLSETSNLAEAGLSLHKSFGQADHVPDLQFHFVPVSEVVESNDRTSAEVYFVMNPTQPGSRGYVRLHPTNPSDPPIIQVKYLTYDNDLVLLMEGFS